MNSKIYRCGWCGNPTKSDGSELTQEQYERVVNIIETYGDGHSIMTNGFCCDHPGKEQVMQVARDMAI